MVAGSIVIVARNNVEYTKAAVRTAIDQDVPCEVMVIDNCSADGTMDWLKTRDVARFFNPVQLSLAACWNQALKIFWRIGCEEALVVNNDVELRRDTYRLLRSHGGPFVTCISVRNREEMGTVEDRHVPTLYATERPHPDFSCFLIRKEVTDRVGWFDEKYFPAFCEDCDYHVRMHRAGIRAVAVALPFVHHGSQTLRTAESGERQRIERGAERNRERFREIYGCRPGTPEYEKLFDEASFGKVLRMRA